MKKDKTNTNTANFRISYIKWLFFLLIIAVIILGFTGHLELFRHYTDTDVLSFKLGDYKISLYQTLKAFFVIISIFWFASVLSSIAEKRITNLTALKPSNRTLILKFTHIVIYFVCFVFALDVMGIDLTTLTIFSGALGIGIGFGLQKISSNFISGIILLLEKSVEEGDLIEMSDGTFGFIRNASARFTLVETLDGKEVMVPNEDFITNRVTNWTYSNTKGRIEIPVGVSYKSDIKKAHALILEAAKEHTLCLDDPYPKCHLKNFGDSSVDFLLHFWVDEVSVNHLTSRNDVMFAIWDKFKENDIEIPFPQRDIHIKEKGS